MKSRWPGTFLPLVEKATKRSGRTYRTLIPLFGGYLFFSGDDESRYKALTTNRIAQVIPVLDQAGLVYELSQIHKTLSSGVPLDPHPYLKLGDRCRVIAGPLCGVEGIFLKRKKQSKLVLQVEILGQAAAVEMDSAMIEPID
jgi:transcription antitermination factor NusG